MGQRGPAKTPTKILKMRGSWRAKDRKNEPRAENGRPTCPKWIHPYGKEVWRKIILQLDAMGILSKVDGYTLARYCEHYAEWRNLREFLHEHGTTLAGKARPEVTMELRYAESLGKIEKQFGMTPSARAELATDKPAKASEVDENLFRAG